MWENGNNLISIYDINKKLSKVKSNRLNRSKRPFLYCHPVFSLNFSSAGKGPFMDGKAKNIYFSKRGWGGGGGGAVEGGTWTPPSLGNFFIPIFKDLFMQICCRVIFRQQIKTFDSNNFTMSLMSSFQNACP